MEWIGLFSIIVVGVVYCMIRGALEEKKRKEQYRQHLIQDYGKYEVKEYSEEQLKTISRLFEKKLQKDKESQQFHLDDITWNDLDMDAVFALMNHTQSASGAEYLYHMLRHPSLKQADTQTLEKDITAMQQDAEERVQMQVILHELGSTGRFSLYDYLDFLDNLGERKNTGHILGIIALVLSLILIGVSANLGIFALIVISCINIVTYLKEKNAVLPYLTSFGYIMRMIEAAENILKVPLHEMPEYREQLTAKVTPLKPMHKNSHLIFQMNASSGNPIELLFDYVKMMTHIDIIQFNRMLHLVCSNRQEIEALAQSIGYVDAAIAIGAFRESLPCWCVPELKDGLQISLKIEEGYHPSLKNAVPNSFEQNRGMLITGSNASGKSTFLKMVAINAILAQTIHTCSARSYEGGCYRIFSSMALRDDLASGESYYIVEIKSLKRIMDAALAASDSPLLCFVDEVLRGTNTVERIAASTQILHQLSIQTGVYCFAATHDIELTHLLDGDYDNYHFEEDVKDHDVLFSYHLMSGRAQSRNAIKLLEVIGFTQDITQKSQEMAECFIKTGKWEDSYVR